MGMWLLQMPVSLTYPCAWRIIPNLPALNLPSYLSSLWHSEHLEPHSSLHPQDQEHMCLQDPRASISSSFRLTSSCKQVAAVVIAVFGQQSASFSEALRLAAIRGWGWEPVGVIPVSLNFQPQSYSRNHAREEGGLPWHARGCQPHLLGLFLPWFFLQQERHATGKESEGLLQSDPVHWTPAKEARGWPSWAIFPMPWQPAGTEAKKERGCMVCPCHHCGCEEQQQEVHSLQRKWKQS